MQRGARLGLLRRARAQDEALQAVEVADFARLRQHRTDLAQPPEDAGRAEPGIEVVEVFEAVEHRQNRRLRPDRRRDRLDRRREIIGLAGEQHGVEGFRGLGRHCDGLTDVAERAQHDDAVALQILRSGGPDEEGDVHPRRREASAEITADGARAQDQDPHERPFRPILAALLGGSAASVQQRLHRGNPGRSRARSLRALPDNIVFK